MLSLYIQPATNFLPPKREAASTPLLEEGSDEPPQPEEVESQNHRDPIAFLYYSIVLTTLTVIVAIVIGIIQLLTLVLNVAEPTGRFWDGVQTAGDYYDAIGGGICGCFIIFGSISVFVYKPWRRWIARRHGRTIVADEEGHEGRLRPDTPILNEERGASPGVNYGSVGKKARVAVEERDDGPA